MGTVGTPIVRRMIEVARVDADELFALVGLPPDPPATPWTGASIDENAYYELIERIVAVDDPGFPIRYAEALRPDDMGALGLAMKTAPTIGDALRRLARHVLVLSDTLEYDLSIEGPTAVFTLHGRPHHRLGAAVANECAMAAIVSVVRRTAGGVRIPTRVVRFRHGPRGDAGPHREFFGGRVEFGAIDDALVFDSTDLERRAPLADQGLSTYLLAHLEELRQRAGERPLVDAVRGAIADALPDGRPSKGRVARRLGLSERTLQRRLADEGRSFQDLATATRREVAESLLRSEGHTLAEIAFLTGFGDQTAFTRAFKGWTGQAPGAYRLGTGDAST